MKMNKQVGDFITIYTDASVRPKSKCTQVAWRGKCSFGTIQGFKVLPYDNRVARAEMNAILCAVEDALAKHPTLIGLFINSDSLQCVQCFWTFLNKPIHKDLVDLYSRILKITGKRWIRAKHVKAHTGGGDIRSYMNRSVDQLTRVMVSYPFTENRHGDVLWYEEGHYK